MTSDCYPISVAPGQSRLFLDYCAGNSAARPFFASSLNDATWKAASPAAAHRPDLVAALELQNPLPAAAPALAALAQGAGVVVTGQQVALFGGPLFTPFKAATAIARARQATAAGHPHVAIFWLATEDHDFAEINHVTFPARRELRKLEYSVAPAVALPVGGIVLGEEIAPLVEQAGELLGFSDAFEALAGSWQPGHTFAQAFAAFYSKAFAAQGLIVLDASGREFHRMGAPVLRAAIERADELHDALIERNRALEAAGYEVQVTVAPDSSLLFLIDDRTGARIALKRNPSSPQEPGGLWQAGRQSYLTSDLLGILESEPERISPSALLRPVFQDFLLSSSLMIGGPAEVTYFAQSAALYERILGHQTPIQPRFSGSLIEPSIAGLLRQHELGLDRIFGESEDSLAKLLAARAMPPEGKQRLAAAGNAVDAELNALLEWMHSLDAGLAQSGETAASKIRYQMNRMRELTANFELQKEASLGRHAQSISQALYPGGVLQERVLGAAYYFARYGFSLAEDLVAQAANPCPGHMAVWL